MENGTVLVVEDTALNMKLVRALLHAGKYKVLESIEAETGIQLVREHHPDLVLMDIQLPGMDGLTATRLIRNDAAIKDIPVVALTSHAMQGDEEKALAAGCDGYITKPIDTRDFLNTIAQFVKKKNTSEEKKIFVGKNRILIVDDDPLNVKLLQTMLAKENYEVIEAYDGESTLKIASEEHPDLILLDIMMPGMDGYEATRILKNDPKTKDIPILLITSLDGRDDKLKGLRVGADDFLNKPVNTSELRARVQSLLRLKEYREQLKARTRSEKFILEPADDKETKNMVNPFPLILLVEDDPKDAKIIQEYLSNEPFRVEHMKTGESAVAFSKKEKIDLMVVDILLPGMDGFEVIENLKEQDDQRNAQVVLITSLDNLENKLRGITLGADEYLVKPINSEEIKARVHALLKKKTYMDQLSHQFENALEAAISDNLTGIYNHAYLKHFLDLEIRRSRRQKHPLGFIMLDIDDFKKFNDTHGHLAGDSMLKWLGKVIKKNIRDVDLPARYGGEEFAIVMPYADREGAEFVAKRIEAAIRDSSHVPGTLFELGNKMTVSMGIAFFPSDAVTVDELIHRADMALYKAKREGKNRICILEKDDMISGDPSEK